ncbi:lipid II flippase MurJ [Sulfitobacter sp. R18_1]|uniref:murein biosynthesis integral membrane protein MurJ n=1 Tax=Sulfitobacter sp. R18_1 TaxID=2821104 RepID=UPI001ADC5F61|nr:lipid II flippase MurJ [Sulfitobacter sp. R18_1]MBO9432189.1 hypothetical protein [Sulfitobacter sp. R18_1]
MRISRARVRQVGLVVILMALAKLGAFAKDVLLSLQFGAGPETDAYFIANAIPGFVFGGVFATISLVFLPAFTRASVESEYEAALTYRTAAVGYSALSAFLGALTFFGASIIVSTLAPELPLSTHDLAVTMTRILAFSFVFSGWVGLQSAVLQSHKLLIWPQLVQLMNHFFVIGGLAIAALLGWTITVLAYAAVLGWMVMAPLLSRRAAAFWPKATGPCFDLWKAIGMASLSFPVFLSLSMDQASLLVGTYLGAAFPEGAISHLNYAQRLMMLLSSVFALVIAYVLFPYLTESIVAKRTAQARRYMALAIVAVLLLSAPLLVLSVVMGEAFISFVFQRGAFSSDDALAAGRVLTFFAPVIVLAGVREVLNRLFLACQQTGVLLVFGIIAMLTNVVASVHFSRTMSLEGIALGATCGALVYVLAQAVMVVAYHRSLLHRDLPLWFALIALAAIVSAMFGQWVGTREFIGIARLDFLVNAVMVIVVFAVVVALPTLLCSRLRTIFRTERMT